MAFTIKNNKAQADQGSAGAGSKPAANAEAAKGLLKTGAQAVQMMEKADAEREAQKSASGRAWRFWLKEGEDAMITFLDGEIDPATGILKIPYTNEHRVKINGRWEDVVCLEDQEPCPICAAGERRAFVGYLTVIDHREFTDKDNKKHSYKRRMYVAKSDTLKVLTKYAAANPDGLKNATFEVSRTGDKKPQVGDVFIQIQVSEMKDLVESFGDDAKVLDYSEQAPILTAAQMEDLGVGKKVATIGSKSIGAKKADDVGEKDAPW